MKEKLKKFVVIALISVIPTLGIWVPFILKLDKFWGIPLAKNGMATIVSNYDGPLFLVVAKTFYNKDLIKANFSFPLPTEYYAAHFPSFPILIKIFSTVLGFPYSMLLVTIFSSILAIFFFKKFISQFVTEEDSLWMTLVFAIFPARWLIVRSVGSVEPLFLASIIASVYYFDQKKYWMSGIWGAVATFTKSPGILLFLAFLLSKIIPLVKEVGSKTIMGVLKNIFSQIFIKTFPIFFIPLSLIFVFLIFKVRMNDFFAYFHSGDNIHLFFPPFQIFNYSQPWVGTFWLEEIIFVYLFGALGVIKLFKKSYTTAAWFSFLFFASTIFVSHRDLIRYSLPLVPFLYLAFSKTIIKKEFKIVTVFLILPIYLFSLAYISQNVMPISDWGPLL